MIMHTDNRYDNYIEFAENIEMDEDSHFIINDHNQDNAIVGTLFNDILMIYTKYPTLRREKIKITCQKLADGVLARFVVQSGTTLLNCKTLFEIEFYARKKLFSRSKEYVIVGRFIGKNIPYNENEKNIILRRLFQQHLIPNLDKTISDPSWNSLKNSFIKYLHLYTEKTISKKLKVFWRLSSPSMIFDKVIYFDEFEILSNYINSNNIKFK